ncbi:MAG: MBOAT family protein [Solobacterium sp.]|nr:MBOAT family protein [Solobacterium sp.]
MTFSSLVFICIFLPVVYVLHTVIPSLQVKNGLLIAASLLFYAFGEPVYVLLMIASAVMNYLFALAMGKKRIKLFLILAVVCNIGILFVFKYTGFFVQSINTLLHMNIPVPQITLPIGISFFTFQALSYVIDVYRGQTDVQKNFFKVLLYISFFPQLIAGPIVKYKDIENEINHRTVTTDETAAGLRRFIVGLGKKVLIANAMAVTADAVFNAGAANVNILGAWLGAIAYTMQIYFDFSGYSDMAIGMGRMFGFHFKENFNFPYASASIKEFWRRWHISLSSWFKDYVYIPLGGNRKGEFRTGMNKLAVFFLCGLWHGANWTFVVWGLFHGAFSFLEEAVSSLRKMPKWLGHLYTMLVVCIGFVIFRADTIGEALGMIGKMFAGWDLSAAPVSFALQQCTPYFLCMLVMAVVLCAPAEKAVKRARIGAEAEGSRKETMVQMALYAASFVVLAWCIIRLSGGSYNPFIYFRF